MAMTLWRDAPDEADGTGCPEAMDASGEDRTESAETAGATSPEVVWDGPRSTKGAPETVALRMRMPAVKVMKKPSVAQSMEFRI